MSFRPHEGDPSSLPGSRQWPLILNLLPSPRRGPIFSTSIVCGKYVVVDGFRPHEGDPSSLPKDKRRIHTNKGFRPHEGDPSSLPENGEFIEGSDFLPSPRRGPIFSTL